MANKFDKKEKHPFSFFFFLETNRFLQEDSFLFDFNVIPQN